MDILICQKCGKAKKAKGKDSLINGIKIYKKLAKWLKKHPEIDNIKIKKIGCLNQCKKKPVLYIKNEKRFLKSITKKRLKKFIEELTKQPHTN